MSGGEHTIMHGENNTGGNLWITLSKNKKKLLNKLQHEVWELLMESNWNKTS